MTPKEAINKYGKKIFKKMQKSGELEGITVCVNKKGEVNIPERDLERAYDIISKGWSKVEWD